MKKDYFEPVMEIIACEEIDLLNSNAELEDDFAPIEDGVLF